MYISIENQHQQKGGEKNRKREGRGEGKEKIGKLFLGEEDIEVKI